MINDLGDRLSASRRRSQTSDQCTWDILYTREMLQEGTVDYERCLPGLCRTWREQARCPVSGSCAPSAVPSDETCPYVLAQMSRGDTRPSVAAAGSLAPKMVLETLV